MESPLNEAVAVVLRRYRPQEPKTDRLEGDSTVVAQGDEPTAMTPGTDLADLQAQQADSSPGQDSDESNVGTLKKAR